MREKERKREKEEKESERERDRQREKREGALGRNVSTGERMYYFYKVSRTKGLCSAFSPETPSEKLPPHDTMGDYLPWYHRSLIT